MSRVCFAVCLTIKQRCRLIAHGKPLLQSYSAHLGAIIIYIYVYRLTIVGYYYLHISLLLYLYTLYSIVRIGPLVGARNDCLPGINTPTLSEPNSKNTYPYNNMYIILL